MITAVRPFEVLFLTNFSDSCFRAIPAVAQLSDDIDVRLTILHAHHADGGGSRTREAMLQSFFPEADRYATCRRVLRSGSALEAVRHVSAERGVDLVIAPAADPLGMPRLGHRSLRARLVRDASLPTWTSGLGTPASHLLRPTRTIACCLELERENRAHLRLACAYAEGLQASLHIVHVLPDIQEGHRMLLLAEAEPFDTDHARRLIRRAGATLTSPVEVHVTDRAGLGRTLSNCDADVAFLDGPQWVAPRWFSFGTRRPLDELPCPAVCIDGNRSQVEWHISRNPSKRHRPVAPFFEGTPVFEPAFGAARAFAGASS